MLWWASYGVRVQVRRVRKMSTRLCGESVDGIRSPVELTLSFVRTSDEHIHKAKLQLCPETRTVADLKRQVQSQHSVPVCQQKVTINNHPLNDTETVAELYIRHHDNLTITYYNEASVQQLVQFLSDVLEPLVDHLQANPRLPAEPWESLDQNIRTLILQCEDQLHRITHTSLLPWEGPVAEANRQLIIQEGGVTALLQLYGFLQASPWEQRSVPMQGLEVSCVSFFWNFGETAYARRLVVGGGGFDKMLGSLLVYSDEEFLSKYRIHWVFDSTVGAISNYAELETCQRKLVQNTRILHRLLHFAVHGLSLNIFTKMLIANCIFRLSHTIDLHAHLTQQDTLDKILDFHQLCQQEYAPNQLMRYTLCLALARVVLYSYPLIPEHLLVRVQVALKDNRLPTPLSLMKLLEKFQYNWITVIPLVEALYVPSVYGEDEDTVWKDCKHASIDIVINGLRAEMGRHRNRQLVVQQGLLEYVVCLPWGMSEDWVLQLRKVIREFHSEHKFLPVPRLSTITIATLARTNKEFSIAFRKYL